MIVLDILLLIMTTICIVYSWMLNRRIHDLQNSRIEFARMIKELNASIVKAENNVSEMSKLSKVTSAEIKSVVAEARDISTKLVSDSEFAKELSIRLSEQFIKLRESQQAEELSYTNISKRSGEKFTEEDLVSSSQEDSTYTEQIKNFIQNIVIKKSGQQNGNLNQAGYYDTLRKINARK
jgi:hypothetical protein